MRYAACAVLLSASVAPAQTVTMPKEVSVPVGRLAAVKVESDGTDTRYVAPADLDVFREYDPDPKVIRLRVIGYSPGKYQLVAITCKGDRLSDPAVCVVTVGTPVPVPPGPTPPGPTPPGPTPPAPDPAAPFAGVTGPHVLIVFESADLAKMPPAQQEILYGQANRTFLDSLTPVGPDGKTHEWRMWDADVSAAAEPAYWQAAMKLPRASTPWVYVGNGRTGYSGPLPANVADFQALVNRFKP